MAETLPRPRERPAAPGLDLREPGSSGGRVGPRTDLAPAHCDEREPEGRLPPRLEGAHDREQAIHAPEVSWAVDLPAEQPVLHPPADRAHGIEVVQADRAQLRVRED